MPKLPVPKLPVSKLPVSKFFAPKLTMSNLAMPKTTALFLALLAGGLGGCTTYTWPDGSQETVLGVPAEEEHRRYEERQPEGVRYRIPGEMPETNAE